MKVQRIWPALNQTFVILGCQKFEKRTERANRKMSVLLHIDKDNCTIEEYKLHCGTRNMAMTTL